MFADNAMTNPADMWHDESMVFKSSVNDRELTPYELYVRAHNLYCTRPANVSMTSFITDDHYDWTRRWYTDWYECAVAFAVGKCPIFVMNKYEISSYRSDFRINH